ncbi:MAG: PEP-CTERM sorting domain-containing protein [Planctomycetaceae bacterium]|nr:PEP-CTERM sorting domain-containing protein [Planctomycetaceae bacterium]
MKRLKQRFLTVALIVTVTIVAAGQSVYADLVAGVSLGAQTIVNQFNNLNWRFNYISSPAATYDLRTASGTTPNLDAYRHYNNGAYVSTFCVEPYNGPVSDNSLGRLNYSGGRTTVQTASGAGLSLTVGAAYLYKLFLNPNNDFEYITGFSNSVDYNHAITNAVRYLMGYTPGTDVAMHNTIRNYLLALNSDWNYWTSVYDPDKYYTEIGNFSIFVINTTVPGGGNGQDHLYIARAANPYVPPEPPQPPPPEPPPGGGDVPEPATILLWTLGTLGALGYGRRRSGMKKLLA